MFVDCATTKAGVQLVALIGPGGRCSRPSRWHRPDKVTGQTFFWGVAHPEDPAGWWLSTALPAVVADLEVDGAGGEVAARGG